MSFLSRVPVASSILDLPTKQVVRTLVQVDTIAAAGSAQADAAVLTAGKVIVTGANAAKGVRLPKSDLDMAVTVVNDPAAAAALLVYPDTGEAINALSANAAFSMSAGATTTFMVSSAGQWYANSNATGVATTATTAELNVLAGVTAGTVTASKGLVVDANKRLDTLVIGTLNLGAAGGTAVTATAAELNVNAGVTAGTVTASKTVVAGASKNLDTLAVALASVGAAGIETGVTAHAGGTQAAAFALSATKSFHEVTIVGTAADSVSLPAATGSGNIHWVKNSAAANSLQLYGAGTDTIDGVATATGVAVAAGKSRMCLDSAAGKWQSLLGA